MKSQKITVLQFSNVAFEIHPGIENIGTFSLVMEKTDLRFEWKPLNPLQYIGNAFDTQNFSIIVRLCEVIEVSKICESMSVVCLEFVLRNNVKLPLFRFKNSPQSSITHLLEFLSFKHYINQSKLNQNSFSVKYPYTKPLPIKNSISALGAVAYSAHQGIIQQFKQQIPKQNPLTLKDISLFFRSDGSLSIELDTLITKIHKNGLEPKARFQIWPYLLKIYKPDMTNDDKNKVIQKQISEYKKLQEQYNSLLKSQTEGVLNIQTILRTISNDVNRTDRNLPQFKDQNSPYLKMVSNILTVYAIYNKDTDYVQGMGDILSPFILLSVEKFQNNETAILSDGRNVSRTEAEAIVFFMYASFMEIMQQDRIFTDLAKNQEIILEKVFEIIEYFHKPLTNWIRSKELETMTFVFRHILLLFKREFELQKVYEIWEKFLSSEEPFVLPRFFLASIIMEIFPKMLLETDGSIGEVMTAADKISKMLDSESLISMSELLRERIGYKVQDAVEALPRNNQYKDSSKKLKYLIVE